MPIVVPLGELLLPVLEALIVGLVAGIVWLARDLLGRWVGGLFRDIPVVGGAIGGAIDRAVINAWNAVFSWANSAVSALEGLFGSPATALRGYMAAQAALHLQWLESLTWLKDTWVIDQYNNAVAAARDLAGQVLHHVDAEVVPAVGEALHGIQSELNDDARALVSHGEQLAHLSDTVFGSLVGQAAAEAAAVVALGAELSKIPGYADAQAAKAAQAAEGAAQGYVDALRQDVVNGIRSGAPALAGTLPLLLAALASDATTAADFARGCGAEMCDWFRPNQGNLGSLFAEVELAGLLGLVAAAVADPGAAGEAVAGIARDVEALGRDVLSPFGLGG